MNIIAIDIGNTNIDIGLFMDDVEESIVSVAGDDTKKLTEVLTSAWEKIPVLKSSKQGKRNGVIVASSVKPALTKAIEKIVKDQLDEKVLLIGKDVPLPIELGVDDPDKVGTDRVVAAATAFDVVEGAVLVADFGSAVTIDLVDSNGIFMGGAIFPGFEIAAEALAANTAQLPKVKVKKPKSPYGKNTKDAINAGLYYSAVGALEALSRQYAEVLGSWPQTIITGAAAKVIKDDCEFVDNYVSGLVVKGIVIAYKKYIDNKE